VIAVLATWVKTAGESCPDCERRAREWKPLVIKVGRKFVEDPAFAEAA